jgi:Tol biopolymer transport system component
MTRHSRGIRRRTFLLVSGVTGILTVAGFLSPARAGKPPGGPPADPAIAFIDTSGKAHKLKVMNRDGSNVTTIYTAPSGAYMSAGPSWSPAGDAIVFQQDAALWRIDLAVVNGVPSGSNPTLIFDGPAWVPAWSPLGDEIVFHSGTATGKIQVIPATGGAPSDLCGVADDERVFSPMWSPDGSRIAFSHYTASGLYIKLIDRTTLEVTTALTLGPEWSVVFLDWARNSDTLAINLRPYSSNDPPPSIYTLDIQSGALTFVVEDALFPSWSPDDARIVFTRWSSFGRLATVDVSTGAITQYPRSINALWPDWRRF